MAAYSVDTSKHATLVASTVDTVTFNGPPAEVEVYNRGTDDIYVGLGNTAPTVAGDNTIVVKAGESIITSSLGTTVKLISAGTPAYSVTRTK